MNVKTFSIKDSIKFGWEKLWSNFLFIIGVVLISFTASVLLGRIQDVLGEGTPVVDIVMTVTSLFITSVISIGYYKIFLKIHDGQRADFKDLYQHYSLFWKYLITSVLYGLMVFVGLILLIVPGIYLALKYAFAVLIVIDEENISTMEALSKSSDITLGVKWKLLGFVILITLINVVGAVLLGLGLLITIPMTTMASVYVYRRLAHETAGEVVVVE